MTIFTRYKGKYTYDQTTFEWMVGCDEFVFDFRSKSHAPTEAMVLDAEQRGYQWYKILDDNDPTGERHIWILTFDGSDPIVGGVMVHPDHTKLN